MTIGEPNWLRYGRAILGGLVLTFVLIGLGELYTAGEGSTTRELLVGQLFINAILVVGLQIFIGNTGIMSFGHMGFATIAGYVVALLLMPEDRKIRQIPDAPFGLVETNLPALQATLLAVFIVVLFGLFLSFALTRSGQGVFAATIITLALLEIVHSATLSWSDLTDGGTGLGFIPKLENRVPIYIVLAASVVVARLFAETSFGRWAKATREDDSAVNVIGVNARWPRTVALLLSIAIVGFGASLKVQDVGAMTPRLMFFDLTLLTLAMLIVGGRRSVTGAILGVVLITAGNEWTRIIGSQEDVPAALNWLLRPTLSQLFLGAVMLGTMLFRPDGIIKDWEIDYLIRDRWRQRESKPSVKLTGKNLTQTGHTLHIQDLSVDFGGYRVLDRVNLQVRSNEVVGLIGPNGAGKTTLINAITGFVHTTSGTVKVDGELLTGKPAHQIAQTGISRTFQNLRLFKDLSVHENIASAAITVDNHVKAEEDTSQLLLAANLWEQRYIRAGELDYGNQRRLELARAAARDPIFLLLDEPTSGMSDQESAAMIDHVRQTAQSVNAGVLVIDHDLHFITQICDRIYVLDYGRMIANGTPDEIKRDPQVRRAYLGEG